MVIDLEGMKIEGASPTELFEGGGMLCNFFKHQADLFILQYELRKSNSVVAHRCLN